MADDIRKEMVAFVKQAFENNSDYGNLTKRELRLEYLQEKGISSLTDTDKKLFSSVVTQVFLEFTTSTSCKQDDLMNENNIQGTKQMQDTLLDTCQDRNVKTKAIKLSDSSNNDELNEINAEIKETIECSDSEVEKESDETKEEMIESSGTTTVPVSSDSECETFMQGTQSDHISELVLDDCSSTIVKQGKIVNTREKASKEPGETKTRENLIKEKLSTKKSSVKQHFLNTSSSESSLSENDITLKRENSLIDKRAVMILRDCMLNSDDSENEEINKPNSKRKKQSHLNLVSSDEHCSDEENKFTKSKRKKKVSETKQAGKRFKEESKPSNKTTREIKLLKRYIRAAGFRVQSYEKLWGNCKSNKDKRVKMLDMLHDAGLKGRPSLEKCKKLCIKIEQRKELEALDKSNIITSDEGRPKRNAKSLYLKSSISSGKITPIKKFSRLKGIVDSEEGD